MFILEKTPKLLKTLSIGKLLSIAIGLNSSGIVKLITPLPAS